MNKEIAKEIKKYIENTPPTKIEYSYKNLDDW